MSDTLNLHAIARLVPHGARVLDLGCGDGAMLAHLQQHQGCTGYGVELDDTNVHACVQRGVNVLQLNLDEGLSLFADQSFDVVLQIDTLQHLRNAEVMLRETVRVGTASAWLCCKGACPSRADCPTSGTTPRISESALLPTLPSWRAKTSCVCAMPLACKTAKKCAHCPT